MENLFESLNHPDSAFFLLCMLVAFLIGFIAAWAMWRGQAARFQQEAADWKKKYEDQSLELSSVREKLGLSTADLAKSKRDAELAHEQLAAIQAEKQKWQRDLDKSLEETVRLEASSHSYQATIEDLNGQINAIKSQNEQLAAAAGINDPTTSQGGLERISLLEAKIASLEADNQVLRTAAKKEDENVLILLKSYNDSTNRLGSLEEKLGSLMAENETLRAELADLSAQGMGSVAIAIPDEESSTPLMAPINPADKEAITGGAIAASEAKDEILAAIGNTIPAATAEQRDDLTEIKGIGSFLEKKLNGLGIFTYRQISCLDANLIEKLTAAIEFFPGRIERDDWVGQAKKCLEANNSPKESGQPVATSTTDNLKVIEGIGPKIELLLQGAGIHSFAELAETSVEQLKEVLRMAGGDRYRMHDPSTWPEQARLAAAGDMGKLKAYQEFLSGGKIKEGE